MTDQLKSAFLLEILLEIYQRIITPVTLKSDVGVIRQRPEADSKLRSDNAQRSNFCMILISTCESLFKISVQQEQFRGLISPHVFEMGIILSWKYYKDTYLCHY